MVLVGQHLSGCHERPLVATLHGSQQHGDCHDCLAGPNVALEKPVHRRRSGHVIEQLGDDPPLSVGEVKTESFDELPDHGPRDVMGDPCRPTFHGVLPLHQLQLDAEEFVEHQPAAGLGYLTHRGGPVDAVIGLGATHKVVAVSNIDRDRVGEPPDLHDPPEGLGDQPVDVPTVEAGGLGLRVNGNDPARAVADQVDQGVRHLQASPVLVDLPEQDGLPTLGQLLLAPRLVEEHQIETLGLIGVGHPDFNQRAAAAGPPSRGFLDPDQHHPLFAHLQRTQCRLTGAVEVAARVVGDQVEYRRHPDAV